MYDDFNNGKSQTENERLCKVREVFDKYNLISAIHSFLSQKDKSYLNLIPVLSVLSKNDEKKLFEELDKLDFNINN